MARKNQQPPKPTQSAEKCVESVDLPAEKCDPEKAMDELVELSQELGLYDIKDNPLIKDTLTTSQEATGDVSTELQQESNTTVAPEANIAQNAIQSVTEGVPEYSLPVGVTISEPTNDAQYVKDGWDRPVPTKVVTIKKSYLRETVEETLYIANLGGALDTTFLPTMTCPFICKMLLPESKYQDYLEHKSEDNYNELQADAYNEILVKAVDRITFWKALIKVGNAGAFIKPNTAPVKNPHFMVKVLTKRPVDATINTQLRVPRAVYTEADMEGFSIDELKIIGGWCNLSFNSKQKYIKAILEAQGS